MNYTQTSMLVGNLIKSLKFPFLESTTIFNIWSTQISNPSRSISKQGWATSLQICSTPLLKIQSKDAAARNQKQKREI